MIRFLIYCFKIVVFSLLGAITLQFISDEGLKSISNSRFEEWDNILEGRINAELIILGSSRGSVSYNPEIIAQLTHLNAYNLSLDAAPHNIQSAKYNIYLKNNLKPKVIIQNVDLAHFSNLSIIPNKNHFIPFSNYDEINKEFRKIEFSFQEFNYIPLLNYNGKEKFLISGVANFFHFGDLIFQHRNGFVPVKKKFLIDGNNLERLKKIEATFDIEKWNEDLKIIRDQLESDKNIYYFFIWAPEYEKRLDLVKGAAFEIKERIKNVTSDYSNAYFLDYSSNAISKKAYFFYDTFHLNSHGADRFSKMVGEDINQILERNHAL